MTMYNSVNRTNIWDSPFNLVQEFVCRLYNRTAQCQEQKHQQYGLLAGNHRLNCQEQINQVRKARQHNRFQLPLNVPIQKIRRQIDRYTFSVRIQLQELQDAPAATMVTTQANVIQSLKGTRYRMNLAKQGWPMSETLLFTQGWTIMYLLQHFAWEANKYGNDMFFFTHSTDSVCIKLNCFLTPDDNFYLPITCKAQESYKRKNHQSDDKLQIYM